jgi:predicted DNA-binding transcriptional regulator YafY
VHTTLAKLAGQCQVSSRQLSRYIRELRDLGLIESKFNGKFGVEYLLRQF